MTRYISFTIAEEHKKELEPILDALKESRIRSEWICNGLQRYINSEESKLILSGVQKK